MDLQLPEKKGLSIKTVKNRSSKLQVYKYSTIKWDFEGQKFPNCWRAFLFLFNVQLRHRNNFKHFGEEHYKNDRNYQISIVFMSYRCHFKIWELSFFFQKKVDSWAWRKHWLNVHVEDWQRLLGRKAIDLKRSIPSFFTHACQLVKSDFTSESNRTRSDFGIFLLLKK